MADTVRSATHFTIDIENKVGAGAAVLGQLRDNDVNLIAAWGYATGSGKAKLEVVPADTDGFTAAAKTLGLAHGTPVTVFYLTGADRVGVLADALQKLAAANVGLDAVQAVADGSGGFGAVFYVGAEDVQRAGTALDAQ
jgi:predicted amino acid-binding ACT domain protein